MSGLFHLREGTAFGLYAHERVHEALDRNPLFNVVDRNVVPRRMLVPELGHELRDGADNPLGLSVTPFLAPGKLPLYLEGGDRSLGYGGLLRRRDGPGDPCFRQRRAGVYLANCAMLTPALIERLAGADLLFLDGTLWRDDEMIVQGVGKKTGQRMGHISMSGPDGAMARLRGVPIGRRIFIHVNNTNPALLSDSVERAELERAGWEVAFDGMELKL